MKKGADLLSQMLPSVLDEWVLRLEPTIGFSNMTIEDLDKGNFSVVGGVWRG